MNKKSAIYVIITCLVFVNIFIYSNIITNDIPEAVYPDYTPDVLENSAASEQKGNSIPENYKFLKVNVSDTKSGFLQLVNTSHPFDFDAKPSVYLFAENASVYSNKSQSYSVRDINVSMNLDAIDALNKMLDDFATQTGKNKTLIITQGYRTYEDQQRMLDLKISQFGENQTIAQKPGFSEHHTGLAFDMSLYIDKIMSTFTGEGDYKWIFDNAHKYGFILRYPEHKTDITGISYESWHFRYVGIPHAQYIYKNDLALEEYIQMLSLYPFESSHLEVTDEVTGDVYKIYSVGVIADGSEVPVPASSDAGVYSLSGDNSGHIIVTVKQAQ